MHEESVSRLLSAKRVSNSGAGKFKKGDVVQDEASLLCECKTVTSQKNSVSIKKDWILKNKEEAFANRLDNSCIAFNFEPGGESYFVINERLMKFLVDKLADDK